MRRATSIDIRSGARHEPSLVARPVDHADERADERAVDRTDGIPDTPPAWGEPAGPHRETSAVHETWQARQARIFAPPSGRPAFAGPAAGHPIAGTDRTDPTEPIEVTEATEAIADRIDRPVMGRRSPRPSDLPPTRELRIGALDSPHEAATGRVSPSAVMACAAGLVLGAWAVVGLVRAGLARPLRTPVVEVGGFTTTAILALVVLGAGALLVLAAATRSRVTIALAGLVVTGAAVALAMEPTFGDGALAAERDFAIAVAILSGITMLVAVLAADVPRRRRADRRRRTADDASDGVPDRPFDGVPDRPFDAALEDEFDDRVDERRNDLGVAPVGRERRVGAASNVAGDRR